MTKLRPIVEAAFKVDELFYQFTNIDVADGFLKTGDIEEVNEKYDDIYIINEAYYRLFIAEDNLYNGGWEGEDLKVRQLREFINKFK
jgi:hypothetical protein